MKLEVDEDEQQYRIYDDDENIGDVVDFGDKAWLEKDGELFVAFIDSDGSTDGKVYPESAGISVEVDTDSSFEFDDDDEDEEEDEEEEDGISVNGDAG